MKYLNVALVGILSMISVCSYAQEQQQPETADVSTDQAGEPSPTPEPTSFPPQDPSYIRSILYGPFASICARSEMESVCSRSIPYEQDCTSNIREAANTAAKRQVRHGFESLDAHLSEPVVIWYTPPWSLSSGRYPANHTVRSLLETCHRPVSEYLDFFETAWHEEQERQRSLLNNRTESLRGDVATFRRHLNRFQGRFNRFSARIQRAQQPGTSHHEALQCTPLAQDHSSMGLLANQNNIVIRVQDDLFFQNSEPGRFSPLQFRLGSSEDHHHDDLGACSIRASWGSRGYLSAGNVLKVRNMTHDYRLYNRGGFHGITILALLMDEDQLSRETREVYEIRCMSDQRDSRVQHISFVNGFGGVAVEPNDSFLPRISDLGLASGCRLSFDYQ